MARFGIQQIKINNTNYPGITGYMLDHGREVDSDATDGTVYQTAHHEVRKAPTADLTSRAVKAILAGFTAHSDFPQITLDGSNGLVMYGVKAASVGPGFNASAVHQTRTALRGLLYLASIRWSARQKAELSLRGMFYGANGTTDPIATSAVAALPAAPTPSEGFALSSLIINGASIGATESGEITIDPKYQHEYNLALPMPVDVLGAGVHGPLEITMRTAIGDLDLGSGTGAVSAVFTKFANGGGMAAETATFTLNGNWSVEEKWGGNGGSPMTRELVVRTIYAASTRPLTWSVT